jgi:outer membrane biosynthesis protein TonB
MQVLLAVLVVAGSTAWLAVDASKRDWTDNGFAKNVPTWVIGSLLLWPIVLGMYVFVHRKKAPLLAKPEAAPAAAMSGPAPSEQYGPSIDEVEQEEPTPEPEPVVEIEPEPVVEPEPVMEISQPEPVVDVVPPEPVIEPEPVVDVVPPEPVM